jgi:predicted amidophosphoribosyltransferase
MTPEQYAATLTTRLFTEVGAFFCNTRRGAPGTCAVCIGPANTTLCPQCRNARNTYGTDLADLVVPLAYAKGRMTPTHQSEHHVYSYKRRPPAPKCAHDLNLMMLAGTWLHGTCIAHTVSWWQAVTFVPSANRPGPDHPVAELARHVHRVYPHTTGILLQIGPGYSTEPARFPRPDRFTIPTTAVPTITDRHVLIIDDTWVSGDKAQSAALTLKTAGAAHVTILCAARWLRHDWPDHQQFIDSLNDPYNARSCPVTGSTCPTTHNDQS